MTWVWIYLAIALLGTAVLAFLVLRLWRKVKALFRELGTVGERADQLGRLLDEVDVPSGLAQRG